MKNARKFAMLFGDNANDSNIAKAARQSRREMNKAKDKRKSGW